MTNPIECGLFSGKAQYGRLPTALEGVFGYGPGGNGPARLARLEEAPLIECRPDGSRRAVRLSPFVYTEEGLIGFDGYGYYAAVGTTVLPKNDWTWRSLVHDRFYDVQAFRRYVSYMPEWAYQQLLAMAGQPLPDARVWLGDCPVCHTKGVVEAVDNGTVTGWACKCCGEEAAYASLQPEQLFPLASERMEAAQL